MIKKLFGIIIVFGFLISNALFSGAYRDPMYDYESTDYLPKDMKEVIKTDDIGDNPLREGSYHTVNGDGQKNKIKGIINNEDQIEDFEEAQQGTLALIKNGVNYALGLAALVALIYLIYHGFLMLTATGNDSQYKKGLKGLRTAVIALVGMGLSWLIISFIFFLLNEIVG